MRIGYIIIAVMLFVSMYISSSFVLEAYARAPGVAPLISGQIGYETVWLNNDHAYAAIYYPPAVIYPYNAYQSGSTAYPIFVLSSKEVYYNFPILYDTDFSYTKWEIWVKWSERDMYTDDLMNISMPGAELGPEGKVSLQYSISAGPVGSISLSSGEGPDTEFDNSQILGQPSDPLNSISGVWMKLGWAKVKWSVTWTSVKQKGFYLFSFSNNYMDKYVYSSERLLVFNRIDTNWIEWLLLPPMGPTPIGSYTVSYRFIIGDDIPSQTDSNWYVVEGTVNYIPQPGGGSGG